MHVPAPPLLLAGVLCLMACPSSSTDPCQDNPNTPECKSRLCAQNPADPQCQPPPGPQAPRTSKAVASVDRPLCAAADDSAGTIYFVAYDAAAQVQLYRVAASGGTPAVVPTGGALSHPVGLTLKPDNSALYLADLGDPGGMGSETGGILRVALPAGGATPVLAGDIVAPSGIALTSDGQALLVTGRKPDGTKAVWRLVDGGAATPLYQGPALMSPAGIAQTDDGAIYVADATALSPREGAVLRIDGKAGTATVYSKAPLRLGFPAGIAPSGPRRPDLLVSATSDKTGRGAIYLVAAGGDVSEVSLQLSATDLGPLHRSAKGLAWVVIDMLSLMSPPDSDQSLGQIYLLTP